MFTSIWKYRSFTKRIVYRSQRWQLVCALVTVKLYHRFLKSLQILAMIQMHLQFLGHRALRESRPALQESCSTRQESRSMGRVSREGGNLLFSSTVDIPFESKDNYTILQMYIIQWCEYYMRCYWLCPWSIREQSYTVYMDDVTGNLFFCFVLFLHTVLKCLWDYLTISRQRQREYHRIVTETKPRWLFADIHVTWGD